MVVPRISAIFASGTLSPMMLSSSCSAAAMVMLHAAHGGSRWLFGGGYCLGRTVEVAIGGVVFEKRYISNLAIPLDMLSKPLILGRQPVDFVC
jgi:hypothetical protein